MRHRIMLPAHLGVVFHVGEAQAAGVGRWRASAPDLIRPFPGVRAVNAPETFQAVVDCYLTRMTPHGRFAGLTAMRLWGIPAPGFWHPDEPLDIVVPHQRTPPKGRRVRGRRLDAKRAETWRIGRASVVDPLAAVFTAAPELTLLQAVCALDALVLTPSVHQGLTPGCPRFTTEQMADRLAEWGRFAGCGRIREALNWVRPGAESPKETETRLLIVNSGLPEPTLQHEVRVNGCFIARVDLAYVRLRIAMEFEGDGHRTDRGQWQRDIQRERELVAAGWIVIRLTNDDLGGQGGAAFLAHLARAMKSRRAASHD